MSLSRYLGEWEIGFPNHVGRWKEEASGWFWSPQSGCFHETLQSVSCAPACAPGLSLLCGFVPPGHGDPPLCSWSHAGVEPEGCSAALLPSLVRGVRALSDVRVTLKLGCVNPFPSSQSLPATSGVVGSQTIGSPVVALRVFLSSAHGTRSPPLHKN